MLAAGAGLTGLLAGLFLMRERLVQRPDFPAAQWAGPAGQGNFATVGAPRKIDRVILHTTETGAAAAARIFRTPRRGVSAHYLVTIEGAVRQLVREQDIAYHAGNWDYNVRSIGIELEGWADGRPGSAEAARFAWQTPAQSEALVQLVKWIGDRHGVPKDRVHLLGHNQVPGAPEPGAAPDVRPWWGGKSQHHDPGAEWDWPGLMRKLGNPSDRRTVEVMRVAELLTLPEHNAPRIARLEPGTRLEAYGETEGFLLVTYAGMSDAQPLKPAGRHHGDGWIESAAVKAALVPTGQSH